MKKIWILAAFAFILTASFVWAAVEKADADALRKKQFEIVNAMQERRMKLFESNADLKRLQSEKTRIHRQIALILDADPELFELQQQFAKIDQELIRLANTDTARVNTDSVKK